MFLKTTSADSQLVGSGTLFPNGSSPGSDSLIRRQTSRYRLRSFGVRCTCAALVASVSLSGADFTVLDPEGAVSATAPCLVIVLVIQSPLSFDFEWRAGDQ